ncbi:MAG: hypothetical protein PHX93_02430 [Candidatus Peribacteraceae bacterium]|jgi:hypothetical protein|nr:hypothetical protein [Candidatus Peribacteraceae bacterium]
MRDAYYKSISQKIGDFVLGILMAIGGGFLLSILVGTLVQLLSAVRLPSTLINLFIILGLIALISLVVLFIRSNIREGRAFISFGILATVLLPLIVFGACIFSFRGF